MIFSYITFIIKFNCTFKKLTLLIQRYLINKLWTQWACFLWWYNTITLIIIIIIMIIRIIIIIIIIIINIRPRNRDWTNVGNESHNTSHERALGLTERGMDKYIQKIPDGIRIQELQKITLLGTSHISGKVLFIKQTSTSF